MVAYHITMKTVTIHLEDSTHAKLSACKGSNTWTYALIKGCYAIKDNSGKAAVLSTSCITAVLQGPFPKEEDIVITEPKKGVTMGKTEEIMALVMHAGWVGYQIGVGQAYNVEPTDGQMTSLFDAIEHRRKLQEPTEDGAVRELTPEGEHKNWMDFKLSQGWKCGPVKDEATKTHPDLLPWDQLPEVEQRKDVQSIAAYEAAKEIEAILNS